MSGAKYSVEMSLGAITELLTLVEKTKAVEARKRPLRHEHGSRAYARRRVAEMLDEVEDALQHAMHEHMKAMLAELRGGES